MRVFKGLRSGFIALTALAGASLVASAAWADSGSMSINIVKGGFFIGASAGSGTLTFHGRHYPLDIGGISGGLVFGGAKVSFWGTVSHISRPSDVTGIYAAAGAGAAGVRGKGVIVLTNEKGAVLELHGNQTGLMVNADISGMGITVK